MNDHIPQPESPIEQSLYLHMQAIGLNPVCQYWVGDYRCDFCFVKERLIIECDSYKHHHKVERLVYDARRERFLVKQGFIVVRFIGREIYHKPRNCAKEVKVILSKLSQWKPGV